MRKINIALDGYSSCGKSTLAKSLAHELGYIYLDSGAMYRAVTLYLLQHNIDIDDEEAVATAMEDIHIDIKFHDGSPSIFLNGKNVDDAIRTMEVSRNVSPVSAVEEVREHLVKQQRKLGKQKGIVMDGRDIGTVVFPDAELKFFMTADFEVRAQRRYKELLDRNIEVTFEEVKKNLAERDYLDSHRQVSPLTKADDAIVLDNTNMTQEEMLEWAMDQVRRLTEKLV